MEKITEKDFKRGRMKEKDRENENLIEGRNAVLEAFRAGKTIDKLLVLDGCQDGPVKSIIREAKKQDTLIQFVTKERLSQISETGKHQGVIAYAAAYAYAEVEDMLKTAEEKGEDPFLILLDNIEDPHNLGAIIRTAECAGAHGVIIPKRRSAGLTAVVAKTSAGAVSYLPVARVPNIPSLLKDLQKRGLWIFGTAAGGTTALYDADLRSPAAIVIGSEGDGMGRLVREGCDFLVSIPMKGRISSLNASAAAAILLYEALRQRG